MQIQLTGHHLDLTDSLRDYVNSKFARIARHYEQVLDVHAVLTVEKLVHKAEATVHISGTNIFADAEAADMYAAIDALVDKLDRQVKKHKEKSGDYRGNSGLA